MKTQIAIGTLATAVVVTPLAVQQSKLNHLREKNVNLQTIVAQLDDLEAENERLNRIRLDAEELERRRADQQELIALRSEVAGLRQDNTEESLALQREIETLRFDFAKAKEEGDYFQSVLNAEALQTETINKMKQLGLAVRIFGNKHDERFPTTFEEIKNEMGVADEDRLRQLSDQFEYVAHARPISDVDVELLLFREKVPRQLPDGRWARAYTFADGSAQNVILEDGNFDEWERDRIVWDE